jgi:hypothetical protein
MEKGNVSLIYDLETATFSYSSSSSLHAHVFLKYNKTRSPSTIPHFFYIFFCFDDHGQYTFLV